MTRIVLGFFYALAASVAFSLFFSLAICCGADLGLRNISDAASPILGIFTGAYFTTRKPSWISGAWIGLLCVLAWIEFWFYAMGRFNPLLWIEDGLPHLTPMHLLWWAGAILTGAIGGMASRIRFSRFLALIVLTFFGLIAVAQVLAFKKQSGTSSMEPLPGFQIEQIGPKTDQTTVQLLTFDFAKQRAFTVGVYDCDSDDASPYDNANTTYMGQSLSGLVDKLDYQAQATHRQLVCAINGGFFGATGFSVGQHEEPIVQDGRVLYDVDLLRPRDQAWFFAVNSAMSVMGGQPRFAMLPSIPWKKLESYHAVLGGVRPLRVEGNSVPLKPGAGATTLQCARTSVAWSTDGSKFYVLVVSDPDSEAAAQFQRKMHWAHFGGWDVRAVQKFWEEKGVPFALLFDGGESTQLAYRGRDGDFRYLLSGYEYSYTLGYLFERPLLVSLPFLPPSEGHRGVLNYLYIDGPIDR